jgi:hypothetical protein
MAFTLKLGVSWASNMKSLYCRDVSGTGLTGWGNGGNPTIASSLTATITITLPDNTTLAPINVYPTLPNTNDIYFEVTNVMLGLGVTEPITDGIYYFKYIVTGNDGGAYTYTYAQYKFLTPQVCCCVSKLAARVKPCTKGCKNEAKIVYSDAFDTLMLLQDAASSGNLNEAAEFLTELQNICTQADCGCNCN